MESDSTRFNRVIVIDKKILKDANSFANESNLSSVPNAIELLPKNK